MPDYGDDRGFGLDRVNPFEQTAQAGSMPGYRDRPSDREIDKLGAAYNEIIAGDRAETGVPAPFWAQKNIPSYPPEYGRGLGSLNDFNYVPQNRKFRQDPMSKILNTLDDFYGGVKGEFQEWWDPTDDQVMLGDDLMDEIQTADTSPMSFKMWDHMRQRLGRPPDVTGEPTIQAIPIGPESSGDNMTLGEQWSETAELGLPQSMDWQKDRHTLDELINLGASEEQISEYLGLGLA